MFKSDIRKVFLSPFFYLAIVGIAIGMLFGAWEDLRMDSDLAYLYHCGAGSMASLIAAILGGLAVADFYCIESETGCIYSIISRGSRLRYCISKIAVANLTGAVVMILASGLFLLICVVIHGGEMTLGGEVVKAITGAPSEMVTIIGEVTDSLGWEGELAKNEQYGLLIALWILIASMCASIWPAVALCCSAFIKNKYIVFVTPLLFRQIWNMLFVGVGWWHISTGAWEIGGRLSEMGAMEWPIRITGVLAFWMVELFLFTWGVNRKMK